jgi:hypothetical protein
MTWRNAAFALLAITVFAGSAAADPMGAVIAAPGDCAQPIGDFVTPPVYGESAGVAGPASDHFAPAAVDAQADRLLPLQITRTVSATASGATTATLDVVAGATDAVGAIADGAGSTLVDTSGAISAFGAGALGSTTNGIDALGTNALGEVSGAVGALGTGLTSATSGIGGH